MLSLPFPAPLFHKGLLPFNAEIVLTNTDFIFGIIPSVMGGDDRGNDAEEYVLEQLLEHPIAAGVDGIYAVCASGEF
mgnify:CR=1 FL=1